MEKEHYGFLYGLLAALFSTMSAIFIKLVGDVPNNTMVFVRFFVAFLFLLPAIFQGRVHLHVRHVRKHIWRGITGLAAIYCYFYSVSRLDLVDAVTLSNMTPLFMPLVIFFWLKMTIPKARIWALAIGFLGVVLILRPGAGGQNWAMIVGVLGAFSSAFALVGIRQLSKTESTETIMTYYFVISLVVLFIPMLLTWEPIEKAITWLYLLLIGIASVCYQFLITKSLTHAPATKVTTMTYLSVVFSGLFGWLLFNEVPSPWVLLGVVLIVAGGLIALFSKEASRKRS